MNYMYVIKDLKLQIDNIKECIGNWQNHPSDDLLSDWWCTCTLSMKYIIYMRQVQFFWPTIQVLWIIM